MADAVVQAVFQSPPGSGSLPGGGGEFVLWQVFSSEVVNGTGVVDSVVNTANSVLGFVITPYKYFGVHLNATSVTGTADIKLEIIQSFNDTAANYVSPNTGGTIVASHGETAKVYSVTPVPMPRLRFRVTGVGSNPTDTIVTMYFWAQS